MRKQAGKSTRTAVSGLSLGTLEVYGLGRRLAPAARRRGASQRERAWLDKKKVDQVVQHRPGEQQAVGAIQDPTVAGDEVAGIFQADLTLDHRLG